MLAGFGLLAVGVLVFLGGCQALGWGLGMALGVLGAPFVFLGTLVQGVRELRREQAGRRGAVEAVVRKVTAEGASWEEVKRRVAQLR